MIKLNIVAVGKVKEKYFSDGINEYIKRLSKFCKAQIIEVEEENFKTASSAEIETIKQREAERILPKLKGYVFVTAIEGKEYSSVELATELKDLTDKGEGEITFVIGGSYGLDEKIKGKADKLISFSKMTLPHTLFRLILTEQLYRAFSINAGSAYHK